MKKAKIILRNLALIAACIIAFVIFNNQDFQTRLLIGIYVLIVYVAYLAHGRIDQLEKEKLYHCIFEKDVIAADSDKAITSFVVQYKLPFAPYIGLEVGGELNPMMPEDFYDYDTHDFQQFYTGKITNVVWRNSRFACKVEPYKLNSEATIEEVIVAFCEHAWRIDGLYLIRGREALFRFIDTNLSKLEKLEDERSKNQRVRLERVKKKLEC